MGSDHPADKEASERARDQRHLAEGVVREYTTCDVAGEAPDDAPDQEP